jgi:hypothetical protein
MFQMYNLLCILACSSSKCEMKVISGSVFLSKFGNLESEIALIATKSPVVISKPL